MTNQEKTTFGIIRHAPTLWNEVKRIQGQHNSPLSERGISMAEQWGKQISIFPWQQILCSDLGRVLDTAKHINTTLTLPITHDKRLREQDWGDWSGMTLADLKKQHKQQLQDQVALGWDFRPPQGESRLEVLHRCLQGLQNAHNQWPGQSILVVCHEGVIKCLLYHLLKRKFLPDEPAIIKGFHLHHLEQQGKNLYLKQANQLCLAPGSS